MRETNRKGRQPRAKVQQRQSRRAQMTQDNESALPTGQDEIRFGPKVRREKMILEPWNGLIFQTNGEDLQDDWIRTSGVLVGNSSHRRRRNK